MTLHLFLMDLVNYSAQIAALIAVGSAAPLLLRVGRPHAMLLYRQLLLAACLLLPVAQPWRHPASSSSSEVSITAATVATAAAPARHRPTLEEIVAWLLCAGILARLLWLAAGLRRLRRHRIGAEPLTRLPFLFEDLQWSVGVRPTVGLSAEVAGPVTFGIRNPVILLPSQFLDLPESAQQAIACHEMAHIRRRDWAFTVAEEIVRAVFWFHPFVWWLLGQIQLSREQAVDSEVIAITSSRERYIDALLAVAGGHLRPDLAPAPLFLRRSHLSQRVALILKGVPISKQRLISSLAAICAALAVTARLSILYFPISAPAQEVRTGEANLLHRAPIQYPADAIEKGIEGTVVVEAAVNERGIVADARVISGPEALRKAALKSVLDWHYSTQAQSPVQIAIDFKLPDKKLAAPAPPVPNPPRPEAPASSTPAESGKLHRIQFVGMPQRVADELAGHLPVRVGDEIRAGALSRIRQAVREVDEHLDARWAPSAKFNGGKEVGLIVFSTAPIESAPAQTADSGPSPPRIRVGGNLQAAKVLYAPKPAYPPEAKRARIQGVVRLNVIIGKDGPIKDVQVAFGDPLLAEPAVEAVRQWVYEPTLLNGDRVEVASVVDVNFTLSQ